MKSGTFVWMSLFFGIWSWNQIPKLVCQNAVLCKLLVEHPKICQLALTSSLSSRCFFVTMREINLCHRRECVPSNLAHLFVFFFSPKKTFCPFLFESITLHHIFFSEQSQWCLSAVTHNSYVCVALSLTVTWRTVKWVCLVSLRSLKKLINTFKENPSALCQTWYESVQRANTYLL